MNEKSPLQEVAARPETIEPLSYREEFSNCGQRIGPLAKSSARIGRMGQGLPKSTPKGRQKRISTFIPRSEEHTSELQSLMRISYAVICLKKKTVYQTQKTH